MVFIRQGIALPLQVLMAGDASKRIAPAVQEEALLRIAGKDTAAETRADFIAGRKAGCSRIEIRVFRSVPEMNIFYQTSKVTSEAFCQDSTVTTAVLLSRSTAGVTLIPGVPSLRSSKCSSGTVIRFTFR